MHFSFSSVNENADENEIPFLAEKRKPKSPVPISQNLVMFQLRLRTDECNIFGPMQMAFLERKRKIKQKMKIHFRLKMTIFGAENEFRSASSLLA